MGNIYEKNSILIVTQRVDTNDDLLGFFHGWIAEFAKHCESVTVIALGVGEYDLPKNVNVLSLGKEEISQKSTKSKIHKVKNQLIYSFRFYKYIWRERKNYDAVFVHMNQIYVILGGLLWKVWHNKISLWYAHGYVPFGLRVSEKIVDTIFTSTKSGCRLESKKVKIVGQGIDTHIFKPLENKKENGFFKILTVGRISPIKDIKTLIRAVAKLKNINYRLEIVGTAGTSEQEKYFQEVKDLAYELKINDKIKFIGSVPNRDIVKYYQAADLFVNLAPTGGLDKAILEAMACEIPVIVCNETVWPDLKRVGDMLIFRHMDSVQLFQRIKSVMNTGIADRKEIGVELRKVVINNHDLNNLINKILSHVRN